MTHIHSHPSAVRRRLNIVRWVALADALLLATLVSASLLDRRDLVSVLGPVHGGNFLALVVFVYTGVTDKLWGWWFLVATVFTGGPLGAFIGEYIITKQLSRSRDGEEEKARADQLQTELNVEGPL